MPSFDVVSEVNQHELSNAVDQASREVSTRFDFKGTGSNFELNESQITMNTESEFQLQQMYDMLCGKLVKRSVDIRRAAMRWPSGSLLPGRPAGPRQPCTPIATSRSIPRCTRRALSGTAAMTSR